LIPSPLDCYTWTKFGLTYDVSAHNPHWGLTHALVPTPQVITSNQVAIYASFIDQEFRGRIGRVDIRIDNGLPEVFKVSPDPILDLGVEGSFSQYGVGMGAFWPNQINGDLYFVAFDRPKGFKFKAFTGKATFNSSTKQYEHVSDKPKFGPEMGGETIVGVHDIFEYQGLMHVLVSIGSGFEQINGKDFPQYQVHLASGPNLENLKISDKPIIEAKTPIYRIGRPRITKTTKGFEILVTAGSLDGSYLPEAYYSPDLINWTRGSVESFVSKQIFDFDDKQQCYLSRFTINREEWIVYNGNHMGISGFGFARGQLNDF
jgi:hypothetical protein